MKEELKKLLDQIISQELNNMALNDEELIYTVTDQLFRTHRTLVQVFVKVFLSAMLSYADISMLSGRFDRRNEDAVRLLYDILEFLREKYPNWLHEFEDDGTRFQRIYMSYI